MSDIPLAPLRGRAVEDAAIEWVMAYERAQGRSPSDRRNERSFPGDIESTPRIIEVKATATTYRGWFIPLEPIQFKHARTDPAFHIYVVENVGQGDPAAFTLRVLTGEHLRALTERHAERHYFEMSWPTKDYDATPVESAAIGGSPAPAPVAPGRDAGQRSAIAAAIETAIRSLGGEGTVGEIAAAVEALQPARWKDLTTAIADHAFPGSASSLVPHEHRVLERVSRGRYRLRAGPGAS